MVSSRRQTIDTDEPVRSRPERRRNNSTADDVSDAHYSTTTANTLAGFLARKSAPQHDLDSERVARLRAQKEEARAAVNALNQFIFVAGHTFKGRQLNPKDQKRLCEAAEQVGLSLEVVDALVQQTSNKNAVLNYCMASDDAFATKMKNDPQLLRLLQEGDKRAGKGKFDVADSVWRVFMHKIVQQFLKDHDIKLSDVMSKESLTSRLYEEAIRNENKNSSMDLGNDQAEMARIQRDYTKERLELTISEEEAKWARQQAEADMDFPVHPEYGGLFSSDDQEYFMDDDQPTATDDILSLRPGVYTTDEFCTGNGDDRRSEELYRRQSAPLPRRPRQTASDGEEEVSAVKRGLAMFGKPHETCQDSIKKKKRKSLAALEESKVLNSRARFEANSAVDVGTERPTKGRKQRHSLVALQESRVVQSKHNVEQAIKEDGCTKYTRITEGHTDSTPRIKRLNPNVTKNFGKNGSSSTGISVKPKPDHNSGGDIVNRSTAGNFVKSATLHFEGSTVGETSEGESRPGQPTRPKNGDSTKQMSIVSGRERRNDHAPSIGQDLGVQILPEIEDIARDNMENSAEAMNRPGLQRPDLVVVHQDSNDSNGAFSSLTQSSSSSQEDIDQRTSRKALRCTPKRQWRFNAPNAQGSQSSSRHTYPEDRTSDIDSMDRAEARKSSRAPRRQMRESTERIPSGAWKSRRLKGTPKAATTAPHSNVGDIAFSSISDASKANVREADIDSHPSINEFGTADNSLRRITAESSLYRHTGGKRQGISKPSPISNVTSNMTSFSGSGKGSRNSKNINDWKRHDRARRQEPDNESSMLMRKKADAEFSSYKEEEGWVDFGSVFITPPGRRSLGERSGRGLSEDENDSSRQPCGRIRMQPENTRNFSENRTLHDGQIQYDDIKWNRGAQTLLKGEEQPQAPMTSRGHQRSNDNGVFREMHQLHMNISGSKSNKEGHTTKAPDNDWIKFRENLFTAKREGDWWKAHSNETHGNVYTAEQLWQGNDANPASMSNSCGSLDDNGLAYSEHAADGPTKYSRFGRESANVVGADHFEDTSMAVRATDIRDSLERLDRLQMASTPKAFGGTKEMNYHPQQFYQQSASGNIDDALLPRKEEGNQSLEGGSVGLYGNTETTRSMSSDSDFDAVNAYNDMDKRRIESLRASEHVRTATGGSLYPYKERDSHSLGFSQQPDAPLVSKRGSRVSDVMGNIVRSRNKSAVMPLADPRSVHGQETGLLSDVGLNSLPQSTLTSHLDSIAQADLYVSHDLDDRRQPMVNCQAEPSSNCQMDKQACIVAGVPILERSYQPMNGGLPAMTAVAGSAALAPDNTVHGNTKNDMTRERGPAPNPQNREEMEVLRSHLDSYEYKTSRSRSSLPPNTPTGFPRPSFEATAASWNKNLPSSVLSTDSRYGALEGQNASSTLSNMPDGGTRSNEEESRDEVNDHQLYRHYESDQNSRDRYLDGQAGFDGPDEGPTSPTQLRSADSESTVDEEDIRRAAERRGIAPEVVEVLISQSSSKIRRASLKGVESLPPLNDHSPSHEAPIDSDTCRPASTRYLSKDIGLESHSYYDQGTSWDSTAHEHSEPQYHADDGYPPDPSPRQSQAILSALQENAADITQNRHASTQNIPGIPDLPEGATEEELNLLNRFIEVAASNFDGKKLSADSEKRVRAAAVKVGLSQKFVDQLLEQANANNEARQAQLQQNFSVPTEVDATDDQETRDDASTYYTHDMTQFTRRARKRVRDVGCNAWEQWDNLTNLVRGWANCGALGDVHHEDEDDDASSISSTEDPYRDELTRKLRKGQRGKAKKKRTSQHQKSQSERRGYV